ncbi:hypothetical protein IFT84_11225 [Rhizobium sp. CFBP 8762]|nr:hypothetical protein [Rhizobium sp. CFBP 8762]
MNPGEESGSAPPSPIGKENTNAGPVLYLIRLPYICAPFMFRGDETSNLRLFNKNTLADLSGDMGCTSFFCF